MIRKILILIPLLIAGINDINCCQMNSSNLNTKLISYIEFKCLVNENNNAWQNYYDSTNKVEKIQNCEYNILNQSTRCNLINPQISTHDYYLNENVIKIISISYFSYEFDSGLRWESSEKITDSFIILPESDYAISLNEIFNIKILNDVITLLKVENKSTVDFIAEFYKIIYGKSAIISIDNENSIITINCSEFKIKRNIYINNGEIIKISNAD